jgi:cell division protein ZapA
MTDKSQITVYGKTYNVKTDLSAVNPQDLANYVDEKMRELSKGAMKPSTIDLAILTALNIAGELFEARETVNQELKQKESGQKEEAQKVRHLVQMVEQELGEVKSSRGAAK